MSELVEKTLALRQKEIERVVEAILEVLTARKMEVMVLIGTGNNEGFADLLIEDFIYTSERGVFDRQTYVSNLASRVIEMRGLSNSGHTRCAYTGWRRSRPVRAPSKPAIRVRT